MPKMSNIARVLERSGYESDTIAELSLASLKADAERKFCLERCPHANETCKGECLEFRLFLQEMMRKRKRRKK
jgi:hypothetical protein